MVKGDMGAAPLDVSFSPPQSNIPVGDHILLSAKGNGGDDGASTSLPIAISLSACMVLVDVCLEGTMVLGQP
jgi:hypothetical protein